MGQSCWKDISYIGHMDISATVVRTIYRTLVITSYGYQWDRVVRTIYRTLVIASYGYQWDSC